MSFQIYKLLLQPIGIANVVGVHSSDVFSPGHEARAIQCGYHTEVFLMKNSNTIIFTSVFFEYRACFIGRAVVDDDEFKVPKRLIEHALDRVIQKSVSVVYGHDNANLWSCYHDRCSVW